MPALRLFPVQGQSSLRQIELVKGVLMLKNALFFLR